MARPRAKTLAARAEISPLKPAVLYARVSTPEQEREGFSIPAQQKLLREYAVNNSISIVADFVDVETAKRAGDRISPPCCVT